VEGLYVGYRTSEWAVAGAELHLDAGELLGLVGPSGCGKTTLLRGILGLAPRRRGTVRLRGAAVARGRRARLAFRARVQGVWQDALGALDPRLSVGRALDEALRVRDPGESREERRFRAEALVERVGLGAEVLGRRPGELSGGQRQRVGLARALAVEPEILLLDEPVSALDAPARAGILELISRLLRDSGAAGVLCAHDLGVVARSCHRVAVMADGRIVEEGSVGEVVTRPRHPLTVALAARVRGA
jgi:ABC-type glutathione transport system ATPase component